MQEEEERYVQIIKDSNRKLVILELLSNFFNHKDLVGALVKTKIIHTLFQNNRTLDINKLELFHVQYTSSLIDLFQKLKKSKEQHYLLMTDEIYINEDIISKLKLEIGETNFPEQMRVHAQVMSKKTEQLYHMFEIDKVEPFSWDEILSHSKNIQSEYYREISIDQYEQLLNPNKSTYQNSFSKFEKKLLGRLNIFKFKIKFLCGLVCSDEIIEVYEFRDTNDKFIFVANDKSFYFVENETTKGINLSKNSSAKNQIVAELESKNSDLKLDLGKVKTSLPETVQEVLKNYLDKISSVDFLEELQNVDEQTNILKTMLNIKIN